jgi:hypothetical protein
MCNATPSLLAHQDAVDAREDAKAQRHVLWCIVRALRWIAWMTAASIIVRIALKK